VELDHVNSATVQKQLLALLNQEQNICSTKEENSSISCTVDYLINSYNVAILKNSASVSIKETKSYEEVQ
jgi:hypothetical protein